MDLRDWPGRRKAEGLRQWPILRHVARQVDETPALDALIAIGSFATGQADDLSDLDLIIAVADGRFEEAWEQRLALQTPDALFGWDVYSERERNVATRKFLSREIVLVELVIATSASGVRLVGPFVVLVGDDEAVERFPRAEPISRDALEEYAQNLRDEGYIPDVEMRYSELTAAIRAARSDGA